MVNFTISNGSYFPLSEDEYQEFKKEFQNEKDTRTYLKRKYGLNSVQYRKVYARLREEGVILETTPKYYSKNADAKSNPYIVSKKVHNRTVHFGCYGSEEEAIRIVEQLEEHNWNKDELPAILEELGIEKKEPKYYSYDKKGKNFRVLKSINKKQMNFGAYDTEEEAKLIVEELKKVNWDIRQLHEVKNKVKELMI